jgi:hypothetical protein
VNSRRGCGDDREIEEEMRDGFGKGARKKSDGPSAGRMLGSVCSYVQWEYGNGGGEGRHRYVVDGFVDVIVYWQSKGPTTSGLWHSTKNIS